MVTGKTRGIDEIPTPEPAPILFDNWSSNRSPNGDDSLERTGDLEADDRRPSRTEQNPVLHTRQFKQRTCAASASRLGDRAIQRNQRSRRDNGHRLELSAKQRLSNKWIRTKQLCGVGGDP